MGEEDGGGGRRRRKRRRRKYDARAAAKGKAGMLAVIVIKMKACMELSSSSKKICGYARLDTMTYFEFGALSGD